mgnify:CR=1 FL=1
MGKIILILLLVCAIFILSCVQNSLGGAITHLPDSFNGSYKIGVMLALTGDAATYGLPEQQAIKIAIDEINFNGGVNGKSLLVVYEDGKCNPKDGNAAAQKLINIDKVKVIIGGSCSGETLGAAPIAEANKVILISPSSTSPDITNAGDFIFRVAPSDAKAGIVAADYAFNKLRARKAALITESADYPQGLRRVFKENFIKLGGKIASDETYNPEDTDFRTQITKAKASNPDIIYIVPQAPPKGVLLIKQIKEAGLKQQLLTAEVLIGRNVIEENAGDIEGLIGVEQEFDETNPKASALFAKYKKITGEKAPFPTYMAGAYDIVYLIADAVRINGYESERVMNYLYSVKSYKGALGNITIDSYGDPIMDFSVKKVKNGQLVILT